MSLPSPGLLVEEGRIAVDNPEPIELRNDPTSEGAGKSCRSTFGAFGMKVGVGVAARAAIDGLFSILIASCKIVEVFNCC